MIGHMVGVYIFVLLAVISQRVCAQGCTYSARSDGDLSKYIFLVGDTEYVQDCPPGTLFSVAICACDHEANVRAQCPAWTSWGTWRLEPDRYPCTEKRTRTRGLPCQALQGEERTCQTDVIEPATTGPCTSFQDPNGDFTKYILVVDGNVYVHDCPPGTLFSVAICACDHEANVQAECPPWTVWTRWLHDLEAYHCAGRRTRKRSFPCRAIQAEDRACPTATPETQSTSHKPCPPWTLWSQWADIPCTDRCIERRIRTRDWPCNDGQGEDRLCSNTTVIVPPSRKDNRCSHWSVWSEVFEVPGIKPCVKRRTRTRGFPCEQVNGEDAFCSATTTVPTTPVADPQPARWGPWQYIEGPNSCVQVRYRIDRPDGEPQIMLCGESTENPPSPSASTISPTATTTGQPISAVATTTPIPTKPTKWHLDTFPPAAPTHRFPFVFTPRWTLVPNWYQKTPKTGWMFGGNGLQYSGGRWSFSAGPTYNGGKPGIKLGFGFKF